MSENLCLAFRDRVVAEPERLQAAWDFAERLAEADLKSRVGVCVEDPLWFAFAFLRVLASGGTPVVMPERAEAEALGVRAILSEDGWQRLGAASLGPRPGHYVAFSSGSTGRRRPLWYCSQRARGNARAHARALQLTSGHRLIQTLRIHHSFGLIAYIFTPLECGVRIEPGVFFDALFPQLRQHDLPDHVVHLTPYHLQFLRRRRVELPFRVGLLTVGAGPLRRQEAIYAQTLCQQLYTTYGLSEAGPRVSSGRVDVEAFVDGWVGWPLVEVEARVDPDGALWLKTPYQAEVEADEQGYLETGDAFELRDDGSMVFRSRLHDVVRLRGQTYDRLHYQQRIEDLLEVPVALGQQPYSDDLVVFLEASRREPQLEQRLARALPELREARVHWCSSFPRSPLGKPDLPTMMARWGNSA